MSGAADLFYFALGAGKVNEAMLHALKLMVRWMNSIRSLDFYAIPWRINTFETFWPLPSTGFLP